MQKHQVRQAAGKPLLHPALRASGKINKSVVAIVGPTASGKTALSVELAKQFNGQVICCDSRTVYRHMNIGTAKPTEVEQCGIPHYMLNLVDPDQTYTASRYADDVSKVITAIQNDGAVPIICGGTGLYFKAALEGLQIPQVPPNAELRERLNNLADQQGNVTLHTQLTEVDPVSASRIHINDRFRLVRALEVSLATGTPFSEVARSEPSPYDILWIGLGVENRSILQERIHKRLLQQMDAGLIDEVSKLYDQWGDCDTLLNTINYSEFIPYLAGSITKRITKAESQELCLRNNYQLARRQIMWFKRNQEINWFFIDKLKPEILHLSVAKLVAEKLNFSG
jgi:tRNA dimethylallyltransferase